MSAPSPKRFRVLVSAHYSYKLTLEADSKRQALARAKRLWREKGDEAFTAFAGDVDDWDVAPE